jgi:signal transduction histidine kinase
VRAPLPSNEAARLDALDEYEILDSSTEQAFDELTRLAAHICGTPTALISLVDSDRQWFKSKVGLEASETPRDVSFCAHAILQPNLFIVRDADQDFRFAKNPLVTVDPKIRFYGGAPLITPDNFALGTLCTMDYVPRDLSSEQQEALQILARQVMMQLELRRHLAALKRAITQCQQSEQALKETETAKLELEKEITERKRAEEALRSSIATNRALLNAIPDLMFRVSSDSRLVNFKAAKDNNPLLLEREFLGKNLYEVLPTEVAQPAIRYVQQALSSGEIQIFEYQLPLNGNMRDYEARIVVSAENEVIAISRDITDRKRAEEDIRTSLKKEKELSELKSRFITMASHEFRTPLTTILSSAELLQDYGFKWNEEKKLQHLQRIQKAVKHMTQLLNDVLLIGKAEAGKLECNPAPLDLFQFCRDLVDEMQLGTDNHTIAFRSQGNCTNTYLDEKLLRHILSNLLSNAIKYSPTGSIVQFNLICEQREAIFRVQDEGIGIPSSDQAQLFDSFYRASNVGNIPGTGLGLAIVKKSVDLYGGKIAVKSAVEYGTTFTVTLPLNKQV